MKPAERLAVIDCGTNTFHLLIGEYDGNKIRFLHRSKRVVKTGNKPDPSSPIQKEALERAYSALLSFREIMGSFQVGSVIAAGTAALRDSSNGPEFTDRVRKEIGFDIRLIPGELEAELIHAGVRQAVRMDSGCSLIMDIGGGSTEFILCDSRRIRWKRSYRIGAARLLALWKPSDPPSNEDVERMNVFLHSELEDLLQVCKTHSPQLLIGASGSFETIAALIFRHTGRAISRANEIEIPWSSYQPIHLKLILSNQSQRLRMPGMLRMRADMMVPATLLISFVMMNTGIRNMKLSRFALKEGLFFVSQVSDRFYPTLRPQPFH